MVMGSAGGYQRFFFLIILKRNYLNENKILMVMVSAGGYQRFFSNST